MNSKFYKIVLVEKCIQAAGKARRDVFDQLIINASGDQFNRHIETLAYISLIESNMIKKILAFDTDNVADYEIDNVHFDYSILI